MRLGELLNRVAEIDWARRPQIFVLIVTYLFSRIPSLGLGFGYEDDAWLMATRVLDFHHSHIYVPSRLPGFPLPEFANSLVIDYGWIATNSITMVLSLVSVLAFILVLNEMKTKNRGLLVLCYAFMPILWLNSTITMDYMWALTFIVVTWFFLLKDKALLGGVMMGLAIASRLTSGLMLLPFGYLMVIRNRKLRDIGVFILASGAIAGAFFSPLIWKYGSGFLSYVYYSATPAAIAFRIVRLLGPVPWLLVIGVFFKGSRSFYGLLKSRDKETIFLLSVVVIYILLFLRTPMETEYLAPILPFGLVLLSKIASKKSLAVFFVLLLINSVVSVDLTYDVHDKIVASYDGVIVGDWEARIEMMERAKRIIDANVSEHSVVVAGFYFLVVAYLDENLSSVEDRRLINGFVGVADFERDIHYTSYLSLEDLQDYQAMGYKIYYVPEWEYYNLKKFGYSLEAYGAIPLDV